MTDRVATDGRHLARHGMPFRIRGATYGSFVPRLDGEPYPERTTIKADFRAMADAGLNTVRVYELPPADVVDAAEDAGLQLLIGLHYHDWRMEPSPSREARRRVLRAGRDAVDRAVERLADRPHVLAVAVGNEVPADVARVHGIASVEDTLSDFVARVHAHSDGLLATYVNFPTTEYLRVDGQDLTCFNVFLEDHDAFGRYLRHLHIVAADTPLVITELGFSGATHDADAQAAALRAQLQIADETGCAGATVFSWTDEWGVNGVPVAGWDFGITTDDRTPKPALDVVSEWARRDLVGLRSEWPRVSVVVCAYNEQSTIGACLDSLAHCRYPNLEVIMCDDGSTDRTLEIARSYPFTVLELDHGGLSRARNAGAARATGDIVAYLDADAACHPEWPLHLVLSLDHDGVTVVGGPNLAYPNASFVERAVALAPGNPAEVLITDDRAEHVPGCNMAYRKDALEAVGGFNPEYTSAGDDVDVCWKLLDRGDEIAFSAAAQVRHHRRRTVRGYLRQQRGYGRAERMLTGAHPERFNRLGQAKWRGFIYGGAAILPTLLRPVVYHGYHGAAPFQPVARRRAEHATMWIGTCVPFLVPVAIAGLLLGIVASPWALLLAVAAVLALGAYGASVAIATQPPRGESHPLALRGLVGFLHVVQPCWRTWGRLRGRELPPPERPPLDWTGDRWHWLGHLERDLLRAGCRVTADDPSDRSDFEVRRGPLARAHVTTAVMWNWSPQASLHVWPSLLGWCALAVGVVLPFVAGPWTLLATAGIVAAVTWSMMSLRRRVRRAITHTTRGAAP